MSQQKPAVVVTEDTEPRPLAWLKDQAEVIEVEPTDPSFESHLSHAQGLLVRTYTRVTPAMLDKGPRLRCVARGGVGIENIDVKACRARGIEVVYTPDANTWAVGDFVFGYMLQLLRPWLTFRERAYTPAEFKRVRNTKYGRQLNELTLGILGMGRVGRRVGHIAALGFGMRVIYNDLLDVRSLLDFPATSVDKSALYRDADVLTIHVDMRPGNEQLVGREQIALMKTDAILINASRGEVLDEHALAEALRANRIAGAGIDVFAPEPPPPDFPLLGFENVILTPHVAARTATAMENMSWVVKDLIGVLRGEKPKYPAP
jgi:phosphoglycerate dehydrogenase-like enzyme